MSAGILSFQQYVGGPDSVQVEQIFPSNQRTLIYNFNTNITGWDFEADFQTIVVDTVQFNRLTGQPNFSKSRVIGSFPKQDITGPFVPEVIDRLVGTVKVHIPADMYTGAIIPDARQNVPITVFALTWRDNNIPRQVLTQRWALVQCWEPDVPVGDPTTESDFQPLVVEGA